jgi:hypothetical protein
LPPTAKASVGCSEVDEVVDTLETIGVQATVFLSYFKRISLAL